MDIFLVGPLVAKYTVSSPAFIGSGKKSLVSWTYFANLSNLGSIRFGGIDNFTDLQGKTRESVSSCQLPNFFMA